MTKDFHDLPYRATLIIFQQFFYTLLLLLLLLFAGNDVPAPYVRPTSHALERLTDLNAVLAAWGGQRGFVSPPHRLCLHGSSWAGCPEVFPREKRPKQRPGGGSAARCTWCHRYGSCDAGWESFGSVGTDLRGAIYSQGLQK